MLVWQGPNSHRRVLVVVEEIGSWETVAFRSAGVAVAAAFPFASGRGPNLNGGFPTPLLKGPLPTRQTCTYGVKFNLQTFSRGLFGWMTGTGRKGEV